MPAPFAILWLTAAPLAAQSPAASACPPISFLSGNLAENPSFESVGADGPATCWQKGNPIPPASAAAGWTMHTSNDQAPVCSALVPSTAPGPNGARMLRFVAGGNEGGVFQIVPLPEEKSYMFSVWVFVNRGQVAIQSNALSVGPVAWTTKRGEWEQLRVCTNSLTSTNSLIVYNQDPAGGEFLVDRVELREILALE
jgi:hypothetical protein